MGFVVFLVPVDVMYFDVSSSTTKNADARLRRTAGPAICPIACGTVGNGVRRFPPVFTASAVP